MSGMPRSRVTLALVALLILVIVVLIFGAGRLPQLGRGIGEGIKNFKDGLRSGSEDNSKKP